MGVGGSVYSYKTKDFVFVHLNRLTWRQIISHDNGRFHIVHIHRRISGQILNQTIGNISDIRRTCLHIIIVHAGKHFRKIVSGNSNSIFCIDHLITDHIADRILIILIFQHHLMYFKNRCARFSNFFDCLVVQFLKLLLRSVHRFLHTGDLAFCICDFFPFYLYIIFLKYHDRS